jgi:hypothetical protein
MKSGEGAKRFSEKNLAPGWDREDQGPPRGNAVFRQAPEVHQAPVSVATGGSSLSQLPPQKMKASGGLAGRMYDPANPCSFTGSPAASPPPPPAWESGLLSSRVVFLL